MSRSGVNHFTQARGSKRSTESNGLLSTLVALGGIPLPEHLEENSPIIGLIIGWEGLGCE